MQTKKLCRHSFALRVLRELMSGRTRQTRFMTDHTHPTETAHIILDGEMTLTSQGKRQTYRRGERCDVPAGAVRSARMSSKGCRYVVGES